MKILFITSSRIGDALLSTGLLNHIAQTHPEAKVTIVCGPLCTSLFEGYPNLERVIPLKKKKWSAHWMKLWDEVFGTKWDMVVDLRNSAMSRLLRTNCHYVFGSHIDKSLHKVEQNSSVMQLDYVPDLKLWSSPDQEEAARGFIPDGLRVIGVGPSANWAAKTWPAERFVEVVDALIAPGGLYEGAHVAVFAAPGEEQAAYHVLNAVPEDKRIDVIAKANPGTAAAVIARCDFYIGNDSVLMHCAAAAGVKALGLFGPSWPHLYRPWGDHCGFVATPQNFDELTAYEGYDPKTAPCLMEGLSVEDVLKAIV